MLQASNPKDLGLLPDRLDRIGAFIQRKYIDTGLLPHGALLIGRGDEIAHLWTSGVDQDAIFRIASMTKPVTSIALMQLVEQGLVGLLNPVSDYLPEFANIGVYEGGGGATPFITRPPKTVMRVVDLLRHTAGFTYSFQEMGYVDAAYRRTEVENWSKVNDQEFIDILAQLPIEFDPGTEWNYSVATDIIGVIVARVSGQPLGEYFQQHIFGPLGMVDTGFQVPADQAHRLPAAYAFHPSEKMKLFDKAGAESGWARPRKFHSGGGGLASTLSDYNRFCRMLLNGGALDGVQIISPKTLDLMTANHLPGGGDLTQHSRALFSEAENGGIGFGLGFACNIDPAATALPGSKGEFFWGGMFSTAFLVDPVEHMTMVFMTQLMPSTTYPLRREIRTMMYAALAA
ncbi:MAG: class A beta-lactamase-related serine hydrolase [Sphingomonadaceae bacterium]|jgi:CubicO group peptidase (beta-lactamase class C family)|nr:class A beta-lactamase-related serine hydrolase [Sphingomonadaceae bacterium]NBU78321.1 class A beta-lactamase-related serine hydrolase [Sphingomonadaceae bacterium]NCA01772.1 class A beta-lactamase-related serine hydrolase [Sphingomonadaceae bacterium]